MKPVVKFSINVEAIDCYLYGGYLFLVMADGQLLYVSYHKVVNRLKYDYPQYSSLIELIFLHNEYSKGEAAKIIFGVTEIREVVEKLWQKASNEIEFELNFKDIQEECKSIGEYSSIPLDIRLYGYRLFLGCKDGLYESRLNSEDNYLINPSHLEKCYDGKVIGVNANYGSVVISADWDGLLTGEILDFDSKFRLDERHPQGKRSLRTGWMKTDLMNYEGTSEFDYYRNEYLQKKDTEEKQFYSKAKISEKKIIKQFGTEVYGMETLFNKSNIDKEDIVYSFNSSQKGFFVMSDGSILNATVRANGLADSFYISSRSTNFAKFGKDIIDKPLSSCIVPSGCILEFFDKVVLIQNSQSLSLVNHSVNSVRSYTSSTNYRNIVSVVDDDKVTFCSIFGLDSLNHKPAFPKISVPANGFEPMINEKWGKDLPF